MQRKQQRQPAAITLHVIYKSLNFTATCYVEAVRAANARRLPIELKADIVLEAGSSPHIYYP